MPILKKLDIKVESHEQQVTLSSNYGTKASFRFSIRFTHRTGGCPSNGAVPCPNKSTNFVLAEKRSDLSQRKEWESHHFPLLRGSPSRPRPSPSTTSVFLLLHDLLGNVETRADGSATGLPIHLSVPSPGIT